MNVDGIEIPLEVEAQGGSAIAAYVAEQKAASTITTTQDEET